MFRAGVLLNSGDAIERLADVDRVVFDKTGTLTLPELDVVNAGGYSRTICSSLPAGLRWPAIIRSPPRWRAPPGARSPLPGVEEGPGRACAPLLDGVEVRLGRPSFCGADRLANEILARDPEVSVVAFSHGEAVMSSPCASGCARMRRPPLPRSKARGIAVEILSGDREPAVRHAAQTLGVHEWRAGVTPAEKIARIENLKRQGVKVMMVGDGMNDAPALAAAHVSMSPVSATHLSQATADLVFLGEPLAPVVAAIDYLAQGDAADAAESVAGGRLQSAGGADRDRRAWRRRWSPPRRCPARRCW